MQTRDNRAAMRDGVLSNGRSPLRGGPSRRPWHYCHQGVLFIAISGGSPGGPAALNEITIRLMSKGGRELTGVWSQPLVPEADLGSTIESDC